ncbi:MAG: glycosyl transferase [Bdellovibrionales bacterium GWB1_52_6]|nr:MAG: glycosyl transferase [Bdellovibrionales bacterium GWB1_52_6]OFZ05209.1 MAG: glycosyl transferase [Bdellovibrionales bacterium GWA1_52_35]
MNQIITAPIIIFVYNRPDHTRRTVEALQKNELAGQSALYIFSDGPKTPGDIEKVSEVREYLKTITGFKQINIIEQTRNCGLASSIISGVSQIVNLMERVIVLEDDMVTSPYFLSYMNEALDLYESNNDIVSIHGYLYPVQQPLPEAFFLLGADCWGWATWKRGWRCFNDNGQFLLDELKRRKLVRAFDFNGTYPFSKMLEGQIKGTNNSWAIRWYASAFLAGKLTLYPGRSLVHNIGNDNSGTHCGQTSNLDSDLSKTAINLSNVVVENSKEGNYAFEHFFRQTQSGLLPRLMRKVRTLLFTTQR